MATDLEIAVHKVVSTNPATGETLGSFDSASGEEVRRAVSRAHSAQGNWNALGIRNRLAIIRKFQQLLHENKSGVAQLVSREVGKPYVEALLTEVVVVLDTARFLLDNAYRLLPVVLELGGKDPMLVLDDVDVDVVSSGAVWGAFVNAGQACLSVERCYVHRSLYDRFVERCVEKTRKLRVGNGLDPETDVGPIIHERQLRIVESHVEDAKALGARVLTGGARLPERGRNFLRPTVLAR